MFGIDKVKQFMKERQERDEAESFSGSDEELEEGDMTALLVSAAMVFLPIIGVMGLIVVLLI